LQIGFIGGETKTEENDSFPSFLSLSFVAREKRGDIITLSFEELFDDVECRTTIGFRWWDSSTRSSNRGDRNDDDDKNIVRVL